LRAFDFLDPDSGDFSLTETGPSQNPRRRATNREYLLEYIIAIIKSIPIKGSEGQAGDLLSEYLGRQNAILFLHELEAWLRSPFSKLEDWDRVVQYSQLGQRAEDLAPG
jgi:hypothetical protein